MNDCSIDSTDEGGDPACWAHLFADEGLENDDREGEPTDPPPAAATQAASGAIPGATRS